MLHNGPYVHTLRNTCNVQCTTCWSTESTTKSGTRSRRSPLSTKWMERVLCTQRARRFRERTWLGAAACLAVHMAAYIIFSRPRTRHAHDSGSSMHFFVSPQHSRKTSCCPVGYALGANKRVGCALGATTTTTTTTATTTNNTTTNNNIKSGPFFFAQEDGCMHDAARGHTERGRGTLERSAGDHATACDQITVVVVRAPIARPCL
jgi:hypothetical protein